MCQPVHAWFLKMVSMWTSAYVHVCLNVHVSALITNGVIWTPYDWLDKFYSFYVAIVVNIVNGLGLSIDMCRGN